MDLKTYYDDLRREEAALERDFPDGAVYVTSLFHRERNSTPGSTLSATCRNAARVITDGTHRRATPEEVEFFLRRQQDQLRRNTKAEQANKKQYIVVVDQKENSEPEAVLAGVGAVGDKETGKSSLVKGHQTSNK